MRAAHMIGLALAVAACAFVASCGSSAPADVSTPTATAGAVPAPAISSRTSLLDWPEFGLDPQRTSTSESATGVTAANVRSLRRTSVSLPGTVDSAPVYMHAVTVAGAVRDAIFVTTTYGRALALDAGTGRILWTFTPRGYDRWAGSAQITTATPLVGGRFLYSASPDGLIHKLALADGSESREGAWPVRITRDAGHEKIAAALNVDGPYLLAATGGYFGDAPPYQGHLVVIDRASGRLTGIFNTLCADRRALLAPRSCSASDAAILSRGGPVVEPGGTRVLLDTGNGPWNGTTNFGDSVIELEFPALRLRQTFTPVNQAQLNASDTDLGSSAPALLGGDRVLVAGKDGIMRVLALSRLDGHPAVPAPPRHRLGGELQRLSIPGGGQLFTAPAVWHRGSTTTVFVADENGTGAYVLRRGRLLRAWQNGDTGTSPVLAGGLLYVYDPSGGGIRVYTPQSGRAIARLPGDSGHWNSPIVVDRHVIEPEGNANDHALSGRLEIFSVG